MWTAGHAECVLACQTAICDDSALSGALPQERLDGRAASLVSSGRKSVHQPINVSGVSSTSGWCSLACCARTSLWKMLFGLSVTSLFSGRGVWVIFTCRVEGYVFGLPDANSLKFSNTPGAAGQASCVRADESGYTLVYSNSCTDSSPSMLACTGEGLSIRTE